MFWLLFVTIISILGKLPFININLALPFPIIIKWICVISNFITWSLLEIWALRDYKIKWHPIVIPIIILSLICNAPSAFLAVQYNEKRFQIPIVIFVLGSMSFFPIRSLLESWEYFTINSKNLIKTNKLRVYLKQTDFFKLVPLVGIIKRNSININGLYYIKETEENNDYKINNWSTWKIFYFILTIPIIFGYEWYTGEYSYYKLKEYIWDNEIFAYIFAFIICFVSFYLTVETVMIGDKWISYPFTCYYEIYYILQFLILLMSIFSVGPIFELIYNFYPHTNNKIWFLLITSCLTIFMILHRGCASMVFWFIIFLVRNNDNKIDIELLDTIDDIDKFFIIPSSSSIFLKDDKNKLETLDNV